MLEFNAQYQTPSIRSIQYADLVDPGDHDQYHQWSSFIGIITAIVGNILISFALNVQRYAHIRLERERVENKTWRKRMRSAGFRDYGTIQQEQVADERSRINLSTSTGDEGMAEDHRHLDHDANGLDSLKQSFQSDQTLASSEKSGEDSERKSYLKSPSWWLGIVLMIVGETGNFLAYGFAPASVVSPLGVVALISNCIIAPVMLKEKFRQRDFWGVWVAVAGAVTVVFSAKTSEQKMGPNDIWGAITRWEFELYLGITAAFIIGLMWASGRYGERSILIDLGLVGLFGGYTALSTKGVASLLSDTLWRTLTFPITYLLVFILALSALMQIRYINRALQRFDSTQVIPTQFVLFTLSVIVGSTVLYRDFASRTAQDVLKFIGGCLLTFLGVYLITSGRPRGKNDVEEDLEEEEEETTIGLFDEEYRDEPVEGPSSDDRLGRRRSTIETTFDGQGKSASASRHGSPRLSSPIEDEQLSTPHRIRTPSPDRRHSVAFDEDIPTPLRAFERDPLLSNPWMSSREHVAATTPASRVNTIESASPGFFPSSVPAHLQTPVRYQSTSRPSSPPKTDPRQPVPSLSRHSMSRILPGPFVSPLSGGLSAVVADSLRRGVNIIDHTPTRKKSARFAGALRRARSTRATRSSTRDDRYADRVLRAEPHQIQSADHLPDTEGPNDDGKRRMRSFSDALNWLRTRDHSRRRPNEGGLDGDDDEGTDDVSEAAGPSTAALGDPDA